MNVRDANLSWVDYLVMLLVIVGALNWGLVGVGAFVGTNLNVVNLVLGSVSAVENVVYLVVGLAGLWAIYMANQLYQAT